MPAYAEITVFSARIRGNIATENTPSPRVQNILPISYPPSAPLLPDHKASAVGCNLVNFVGESSRGCLPEVLFFANAAYVLYYEWQSTGPKERRQFHIGSASSFHRICFTS
jgi:hypothetical protein